jgi:uncharacterized protein YwlG (UPF0340 family)
VEAGDDVIAADLSTALHTYPKSDADKDRIIELAFQLCANVNEALGHLRNEKATNYEKVQAAGLVLNR